MFTIGTEAELVHTVQTKDLACEYGNDVPVLATPVLLWLAEMTSMRVVDDLLEKGQMTVGLAHRAEHLAPTPQGFQVTIVATLIAIEGMRLCFSVAASDGVDDVFRGEHDRFVVDSQRFRSKVTQKSLHAAARVGPSGENG